MSIVTKLKHTFMLENDDLMVQLEAQSNQIQLLTDQLDNLIKKIYGASSENNKINPELSI